MSSGQHYCGSSQRRKRVADSVLDMGGGLQLNGINFLEVVDSDAPSHDLRQRMLNITFLKQDGILSGGLPVLGPGNFKISGGSRVTGIEVMGVETASDPTTLLLILNQAGDFSQYQLNVQTDPLTPGPPANIDLQLSSVPFYFKVECPSDFDCIDDGPPNPPKALAPPLNYMLRDYAGTRRLMLDRMAATIPQWTERNPADLGVTLVEALADAVDRTAWFQDATGTEALFSRARLRQSLLRHSRLLGYRPSQGSNARVAIAVVAESDVAGPDAVLEQGTRLLTAPGEITAPVPVVLKRDAELFEQLVDAGSVAFETMQPLQSLKTARNEIRLHDWGDDGCCLPKGSTQAHLIGTVAGLDLAKGDLLIFEERIPFGGKAVDQPDRNHRHLVRISENPVDLVDPVLARDLVHVQWHEADALPFPLTLQSHGGLPGAVAIGNIILADQGRTIDFGADVATALEDSIAIERGNDGGVLVDDGPGTTHRVRLAVDDIVRAVPYDWSIADVYPAQEALSPTGSPLAQIVLKGDAQNWSSQPDLLASDKYAAHLVIEPREGGGNYARFGDNVLGRAPSRGIDFKAIIREGGGPAGNVGPDAIAHVVTDGATAIKAIRNPMPAVGGKLRETETSIRIAAPQAFRRQRRAVTPDDYAEAAAEHPHVVRAYARRRWTGSWFTITLAVDLLGGMPVTSQFANELKAHLAGRRLAGHDLNIIDPVFVALDIQLFACAQPLVYAADVERDLLQVFSNHILPDGKSGVFHPDSMGFGQDVLLSPMIARAMQVEGVNWVGLTDGKSTKIGHFRRLDQSNIDYADTGIIPIGEGEIARLDNDPNFPDRGLLKFILKGGR